VRVPWWSASGLSVQPLADNRLESVIYKNGISFQNLFCLLVKILSDFMDLVFFITASAAHSYSAA